MRRLVLLEDDRRFLDGKTHVGFGRLIVASMRIRLKYRHPRYLGNPLTDQLAFYELFELSCTYLDVDLRFFIGDRRTERKLAAKVAASKKLKPRRTVGSRPGVGELRQRSR